MKLTLDQILIAKENVIGADKIPTGIFKIPVTESLRLTVRKAVRSISLTCRPTGRLIGHYVQNKLRNL